MTIRKLILDGREYILVPRRQWDSLVTQPTAKQSNGNRLLKQPHRLADGSFTIEHVRISLANKIITRRKAAGLTQTQLAKLSRVRVETISRLENGLHMPGVQTFEKIERALNRYDKSHAA